MSHDDIRIGTLVKAEKDAPGTIEQLLTHGFESFELVFWRHIDDVDLEKLARDVGQVLDATGNTAVISSLGIYGNPLTDEQTARDFARLIDAAESFGCDLVCGFTGRIPDTPVPESLPRFREVFGPLVRRAEDRKSVV